MEEKVKFNKFLELYNREAINSFSWYILNLPINKTDDNYLIVRYRGEFSSVICRCYLTEEDLPKFREWIRAEVMNDKLLCNNCYNNSCENKIHFYYKPNVVFRNKTTYIKNSEGELDEVVAEPVQYKWFSRWMDGMGNL